MDIQLHFHSEKSQKYTIIYDIYTPHPQWLILKLHVPESQNDAGYNRIAMAMARSHLIVALHSIDERLISHNLCVSIEEGLKTILGLLKLLLGYLWKQIQTEGTSVLKPELENVSKETKVSSSRSNIHPFLTGLFWAQGRPNIIFLEKVPSAPPGQFSTFLESWTPWGPPSTRSGGWGAIG